MKSAICTFVGLVGSAVATLLGGWNSGLITLLIFMTTDYVTGILVAAVFKKSKKTNSGALESTTCFKGLCKKMMILLFVLIAHRLDLTIGTDYIRDAVIIAFITNELISIIENAGLMGIPIPNAITKAIDILSEKSNKE